MPYITGADPERALGRRPVALAVVSREPVAAEARGPGPAAATQQAPVAARARARRVLARRAGATTVISWRAPRRCLRAVARFAAQAPAPAPGRRRRRRGTAAPRATSSIEGRPPHGYPRTIWARRGALCLFCAVALLRRDLGRRHDAPALHASSARVDRAQLGASYRPGCPVGPAQLRLLARALHRLRRPAHRGSLVVNARVVSALERVFARLYAARFPIRSMRPVSAFGGSDDRSMAADNTSALQLPLRRHHRPEPWSVHAYGEAIDVDPRENPYLLEGPSIRRPAAPSSTAAGCAPGMAVPGGLLVERSPPSAGSGAGRWAASPDYQHFSSTGG